MTGRFELLVDDPDVAVVRLNGRPREPVDGRHRRVVVYCGATMFPLQLAVHLRAAAGLLEDRYGSGISR